VSRPAIHAVIRETLGLHRAMEFHLFGQISIETALPQQVLNSPEQLSHNHPLARSLASVELVKPVLFAPQGNDRIDPRRATRRKNRGSNANRGEDNGHNAIRDRIERAQAIKKAADHTRGGNRPGDPDRNTAEQGAAVAHQDRSDDLRRPGT